MKVAENVKLKQLEFEIAGMSQKLHIMAHLLPLTAERPHSAAVPTSPQMTANVMMTDTGMPPGAAGLSWDVGTGSS